MKIYLYLSLFLLVNSFTSAAQGNTEVDAQDILWQDSIFTELEFLSIVKAYHPVVLQSRLMTSQGEAIVRKSRGAFDPKLYFDHLDKQFEDKNYYDLTNAGLKIPTWYGLEAKVGWEYAFGSFVNPEHSTPTQGLGFAGVALNASGIFMDKRRAELLKAKQYQRLAENDRDNMLNDFYRDAIFQYWEWSAAYMKYEILKRTLTNSESRFENIRAYFFQGELSVIDTLEAFTQIQAMQTEVINAKAEFLNETFNLDTYLWGQNTVPLVIDSLFPEPLDLKVNSLEFDVNYIAADSMISSHPILRGYNSKLAALRIDRRLKANMLMPKINVQYNLLTRDATLEPSQYTTNNYKWGVNFSLPIFLRKERGQLQLAKLKVRDQELKIETKNQELIAKINGYKAKTEALKDQNKLYGDAVEGYQILLKQEELKLLEGESSLFKLTLREIKMFQARLKLVALNLKLIKSKTAYIHSNGVLYLSTD